MKVFLEYLMRNLLLLTLIPFLLYLPINADAVEERTGYLNEITMLDWCETRLHGTASTLIVSINGVDFFYASNQLTNPLTFVFENIGNYELLCIENVVKNGSVFHYMNYNIIEQSSPVEEEKPKKSNGGCADCTPPTLGYDSMGVKKVDDGVCINDSCMDGGYYHTEYPMQSTLLYFPNIVSTTYYENNGPSNMKLVQLGIGVKEIGSPLSQSQAIIEVWLNNFRNDIYNPSIEEIKLVDPDGIINKATAEVELVPCMEDSDATCLKTDFKYSYAKPPNSTILMSNAWDQYRNAYNNYFNDGLEVIYYSPPSVDIQEEPKECVIQSIQHRNNPCQFLPLIEYEKQRALKITEELVPIYR